MTERADEETPQFVTCQPWRIRVAIAVSFFALMMVASPFVPEGPYHLTAGPSLLVGFTAFSFAVHRSVVMRLEDHAMDIRLGWREARIPYEQITEVAVGPRTPWWRIGRRSLGEGATGSLMGGSSVRISTAEKMLVVSAEESYRVVGAIQRQRQRVTDGRAVDPEQTGR